MWNIKKYWIIICVAFVLSMLIKPALCLLILGSLAVYVGIMAMLFLSMIQKKGIECNARILSFESDNEGYKTPIVEFTPVGGELIKEKPFIYASTDLSKLRSYKEMLDKEVLVLYDPDNPKRFIIVEENDFNYFVSILLILVGLIFVLLCFSSLVGYIKIGW